MALPTITDEQRKAALKKAAEVKKARAEVKKALATGEMTPFGVLYDQGPHAEISQGMHIGQFLRAIPGIGKARAEKITSDLNLDPTKRLRHLGKNQRAALLQAINGKEE